MIRSIVGKVMWVGRATVFLVGLAVILAVVFGVASMAFAGNGDPWRLGRGNVATAITALGGTSGVNGPMVRLTNNNGGTDDTALDLKVQSGEAPMTVNSTAKVANLNSDQLDGVDSTGFIQGKGNIYHSRVSQPLNNFLAQILDVPGFGDLIADCRTSPDGYFLSWRNWSNPTHDVWWFNKDGVGYTTLSAGNAVTLAPFTKDNYVVVMQAGTAGRTATITVTGRWTSNGCEYSAQAVTQID